MSKVTEPVVVSEGTLRDEDLVPAFVAFLAAHGVVLDIDEDLFVTDPSDVWDEVWEAMEDLATDGLYFGAHEGDGACFGFWPVAQDEDEPGESMEVPIHVLVRDTDDACAGSKAMVATYVGVSACGDRIDLLRCPECNQEFAGETPVE